MNYLEKLREMADPAYRDFNARIIPRCRGDARHPHPAAAGAGPADRPRRQLAGVRYPRRLPLVRADAAGMVIGTAPLSDRRKTRTRCAVRPPIDNWALCDCFCWRLRPAEREAMWRFIQPYFRSEAEYDIRFAVVMATANFIDEEHLEALLRHFRGVPARGLLRPHGGRMGRLGLLREVPPSGCAAGSRRPVRSTTGPSTSPFRKSRNPSASPRPTSFARSLRRNTK